jgi:antitoxin component HigA of HigAB toxin-antitoxin module
VSSGKDKRHRVDAIRAAKMKREGYTNGQIAEAIGVKRELVRTRVLMGERLLTLDDPLRING